MVKTLSTQLRHYTYRLSDGSLKARFLKGILWSLVGAVISRGLNLVASILAGRVLGPTGFGELSIVQNTLGLFSVLAGAGLGLTAIKYVAEFRSTDSSRCGQIIRISYAIALVTGLVATVAMFILAGWIASTVLSAAYLTASLRLATALVLFGAIAGVQTGALAGLESFRSLAGVTIVRGGCLVILMTLGAWFDRVPGAIIGMILTEAIAMLVSHVAVIRSSRKAGVLLPATTDWRELQSIWRFALPALLGGIAVQPAIWLGNVMLVNQPSGFAALGIFAAADKWRQMILFLPATISSVILSMLSNLRGVNNRIGYRKIFRANVSVNLIAVVIPVGLMLILAQPAMSAYGSEYELGAPTLVVLALSAVFVALNNVWGQVLVSIGLIWWRLILDILLAILLVIFSWLLVPRHLQNGTALANLIAYVVTVLVLYVVVRIQLARHNVL